MLAIEVELLTGRYVATAYNSRLQAEWPPHPARLFSALVATHFAEPEPAADEHAMLEWLEGLGAPEILASEASQRELVTVYVPVNDAGLTDVDAEAAEREEAAQVAGRLRGSADGKAIQKAERALAKAEKVLAAAIVRNVEVPRGKANPLLGARVLPEFRVRQPRTYPSMTPCEPRVTYIWPGADLPAHHRTAVTRLLGRLVRLGHSSSFAAARVRQAVESMDGQQERWRPSPDGETILRCVQPGQLAMLERAFALHRETDPRVMPAHFVAYTRQLSVATVSRARSVFSDDWLVLRRVGGPSLPMVSAAGVARTLRRALLSYGGDPVPELLSGHGADGQPLERDHLAVVPLPFIGHHAASGSILGVALVLPRASSEGERRAVFRRVAAWEDSVRMDDEETPKLALKLGAAGVLELERVDLDSVAATLRSGTWSRPARTWLSATPVALDRNPGDLRSRDPKKLASALGGAEETLRRACSRIGLPDPARVEILPAAPLAGVAKARYFSSFPEGEGKVRRVLTHARIDFAEPVVGPVLLGAGRYLGLGLFRPEPVDE